MKLSVKSDYAARAVLGLARHYPERTALRMEDVADEQGVPPKYLPQILIELKARGIVRSVRGKDGGYLLARPPAEITLGDVLRAVQGPLFDTPALSDSRLSAGTAAGVAEAAAVPGRGRRSHHLPANA